MKPFTRNWWWQMLIDHLMYNCKFKYLNEERLTRDEEMLNFITKRIEIAIKRDLKE